MIKIFILLLGIFVVCYRYFRNQLISSASSWVFCYILIFILYPLYKGDEFSHGEYIDVLALCGIIIFSAGLLIGDNVEFSSKNLEDKCRCLMPNFDTAYLMFCMGLILSCGVMMLVFGVGQISAVLMGNMTGKQMMLFGGGFGANTYTCFLHFTEACLIALLVSAKGKKEMIKALLCLSIYMFVTIRFGFTRIFLLSLLAIFFIFLIRHLHRKKQLIVVAMGIFALTAMMVSMNFIRCFGFGSDIDLADFFRIDYIFESTDFGASYYWFDRLLENESPFISITTYLKPFFVFIPRFIWETKPEQTSMQVLRMLDSDLAASGYSTAGYSVIGEGYLMFGLLGVVLFPFIWGLLCGYFDKKYYERLNVGNDRCISNIYYYIFAVFIIISGQRGDWNQYMFVVIWLYFLPIYLTTYTVRFKW